MKTFENFKIKSRYYADEIIRNMPSTPPSTIYHYTNGKALNSILESKMLWLSDAFTMNDISEIKHGATVAEECLKKKINRNILPPSFGRPVVEEIKETAHYFICCFSKNGDELSQWRAYGDDGHGYSLGFNGKKLEDFFLQADTIRNSTYFVEYDEKSLEKKHKELVEIVCDFNSGIIQSNAENFWLVHTSHALMVSLVHKHPAYASEQEYRFLQLWSNDGTKIPNLKTRLIERKKGDYSLARYLEFPYDLPDEQLLEEIIIGPAADFQRAKEFVEDCLKHYGYNLSKIRIQPSEIPYRS